jgi:hypothetical protein
MVDAVHICIEIARQELQSIKEAALDSLHLKAHNELSVDTITLDRPFLNFLEFAMPKNFNDALVRDVQGRGLVRGSRSSRG